ncbi:hypothetical protein HKCCE2091_18465 [Rhodobacterales bacterium HKCCE2091]|nr:hypothetical protein [Rhodobacterales bacterium HKCCE2091]
MSDPIFLSVFAEHFEPGRVSTIWLDERPITVWRRDFDQKVRSLEQLGLTTELHERILGEIRDREEFEIEPGQVVQFEWFVASPVNTGGSGCLVMPESGAVDGFFDPCESVHFDLWGRVRRGPSETDLFVPPWVFSDDRRLIIVDIRDAPVIR